MQYAVYRWVSCPLSSFLPLKALVLQPQHLFPQNSPSLHQMLRRASHTLPVTWFCSSVHTPTEPQLYLVPSLIPGEYFPTMQQDRGVPLDWLCHTLDATFPLSEVHKRRALKVQNVFLTLFLVIWVNPFKMTWYQNWVHCEFILAPLMPSLILVPASQWEYG